MFLIPLPILALLAVIIAVAIAWWWSSRVAVSEPPVPITMMATRIAFPKLRIADATAAVEQLERAYEIVIPFEHATLVIAYPLTNPASFKISAAIPQGFTRAELVRHICDEYHHVYDAEEQTAETKTIPRDERGVNRERNRTDGVYGIWGRDLDELLLTSARWTRQSDGSVTIDVFVEDAPRPALEPPSAPA